MEDTTSRHPLTNAVEKALPPTHRERGARFLPVIDGRLDKLAAWVDGAENALAENAQERGAARRFLGAVEAHWDDGDEGLVRGFLDGWTNGERDAGRAAARGVLAAAEALGRVHARPQTLWFFLWEMESVYRGLARDDSPFRDGLDRGDDPRRSPGCAPSNPRNP